jgi:hypothetical protein
MFWRNNCFLVSSFNPLRAVFNVNIVLNFRLFFGFQYCDCWHWNIATKQRAIFFSNVNYLTMEWIVEKTKANLVWPSQLILILIEKYYLCSGVPPLLGNSFDLVWNFDNKNI